MNKLKSLSFTVAILLAFLSFAEAGEVAIPNTFTSGTPAKADEVNENFNAVKSSVDDNDSRITTLESFKPIAMGYIGEGANLRNATPNVTISFDENLEGYGAYVIQIDGVNYDSYRYVTTVTVIGDGNYPGKYATTRPGANGTLNVFIHRGYNPRPSTNDRVADFHFVTYALDCLPKDGPIGCPDWLPVQ